LKESQQVHFFFSHFSLKHLKIIERITVKKLDEKIRLYDYLPKKITTIYSRKGVKKALKKERIFLNSTIGKGSEFLKTGDVIEITEEQPIVKKVFPLTLNICFEDEHLAIVEKPAGIPTSGNYYKTLLNALPFNLSISKAADALPCPLPIHRLDKLTSGLVIVAKTYSTRIKLGEMLERQEIQKKYLALIHGEIKGCGILNSSIENKQALTTFHCLNSFVTQRFGSATRIELSPITGRTHQLRIHLSRLGHPIFGDKLYAGQKKTTMDKGLFLQAYRVVFTHPISYSTVDIQLGVHKKFEWINNKIEPTN